MAGVVFDPLLGKLRTKDSGGGGTPSAPLSSLQYNNAGAFGGITGVTSDGSSVTFDDDVALYFGTSNQFSLSNANALFGEDALYLNLGTNSQTYGLATVMTSTATTGTAAANFTILQASPQALSDAYYYGMFFQAEVEATASNITNGRLYGFSGNVQLDQNITIGQITGMQATSVVNNGTANALVGLEVSNQVTGGTANEVRGIYINGISIGGTVGTATQLLIEAPGIGTTRWGISVKGSTTNNYYEGLLRIGSTAAPTDRLTLTGGGITWDGGTAVTAASYQIIRDADATNQLHFNVPTGAGMEWSVNDVAGMTYSMASQPVIKMYTSTPAPNQFARWGMTSGSTFSMISSGGDDEDGTPRTANGIDFVYQSGSGGTLTTGGRGGHIGFYAGNAGGSGNNNGGDFIFDVGTATGSGRKSVWTTLDNGDDFRWMPKTTGKFRIFDTTVASSIYLGHDASNAFLSTSKGGITYTVDSQSALATGTEQISHYFKAPATKQFVGGATIALQRSIYAEAETYTMSGGADVITTASTFDIQGAATASTGVTITNNYAFRVLSGDIVFGSSVGTPTKLLVEDTSVITSGGRYVSYLSQNVEATSNSSASFASIAGNSSVTASSGAINYTGSISGGQFSASGDKAGATISNIYGSISSASSSASDVTNMYGSYNFVGGDTGTITTAAAVVAEVYLGSGTATDLIGIWGKAMTGGGTVTTAYGAKIDYPGNVASTIYTLAVGSGNSYVEGNLNIGSAAGSGGVTLAVQGNMSVYKVTTLTASFTQFTNTLVVSPGFSSGAVYSGATYTTQFAPTGTPTLDELRGNIGRVTNDSAGTGIMTRGIGLQGEVNIYSSTANTVTASGISGEIHVKNGGIATTAIGVWGRAFVNDGGAASTIGTSFSGKFDPPAIGTTQWTLASTGGNNYFAGSTSFGKSTAPTVTLDVAGAIRATTSLILEDPGAGTNTITIQAPTLAGDYTITLPTTDGSASQFLQTDGSGVTTWATVAGTSAAGADTYIQFNDGGTAFGGVSGFTYDKVTGEFTLTQPVVTGGSPYNISVIGGAHLDIDNTEFHDINFDLARTVNLVGGGADIPLMRSIYTSSPTYTADAAQGISFAYGHYIDGGPVESTNVTIGAAFAFGVGSWAATSDVNIGTRLDLPGLANGVGSNTGNVALFIGDFGGNEINFSDQTATTEILSMVLVQAGNINSTTNIRTVTDAYTVQIDGIFSYSGVGDNIVHTNAPHALSVAGSGTLRNDATTASHAIDIPDYEITMGTNTNVTSNGGAGLGIGTITVTHGLGAVTVDYYSSLYIKSAPVAGGLVTLNNAYQIFADGSEPSRFDGHILWGAGTAVVAGNYSIGRDADATNRLHFNVPTGASMEWSINDVAWQTLNHNDGGGTLSFMKMVQPAFSTGSSNTYGLYYVAGAHTNQDSEVIDVYFDLSRTITWNQAVGFPSLNQSFVIERPTYAATDVGTIATGITLDIQGPPTTGANISITNMYGARLGVSSTSKNSASTTVRGLVVPAGTVTLTQTTQVTSTVGYATIDLGITTIAQSGGAVTMDSAATLYIAGAPTAGASVTLTNSYAIWSDAGTNRFDDAVEMRGAQYWGRTAVADANYNALITDHIIAYTSITVERTVTLPTVASTGATTTKVFTLIIKNESGSAFNIIVDGNGAETIDGAANATITGGYDSITIYTNGTAWFII